MARKLTTEEFIEKAIIIHENKYNYSLVSYTGIYNEVKIICLEHGEFKQVPNNHLQGKGCKECGCKSGAKNRTYTTVEFVEKAKKIHLDKYDYSLVEFIKDRLKVSIICSIHGVFKQTPHEHFSGKGCSKCAGQNKTTKEFIEEANLIHKLKYDYSLVDYKFAYIKVKILCPIHGEFEQSPEKHLIGQGCKVCRDSKGELKIREYLIANKIIFIRQYIFEDCKNVNPLPFDFYLPELNSCIEFNGKQHYKSVKYFGGDKNFKIQQKRDNIKYNYCLKNNIKFLVIPYNVDINIELNNFLKK